VDIANFTATAHVLDSEDVYLLTDEAMRLLAKVVYKYEGTIDKYTGDGLMALFGAPVTHENDPERAVRAALDMQMSLQSARERVLQKHDVDFQVRIGINTGPVIAGQVGGDLHMEYTVIGDTVNMADRLQAAAEPGTALVSFPTYQRTRPLFEFESFPPMMVKGKPLPIQTFKPLGLRAKPGSMRGLPGLQVPMVGREDALSRLADALALVRRTQASQIVLITGEAGVGKSRLATEFRKSKIPPDVRVYQGICQNYSQSKPLWLVASLLRDVTRISETAPSEVQRSALKAYLSQLDLPQDDLLPYLCHVLGLEQTDHKAEARLRHLDNTVLLKLTYAALRQVILAEVQLHPTVLVFEDLHWVDLPSRDFLEHLIQTLEDVPLMLVLISRDLERETVIRPLISAAERSLPRLVDIQLHPLSETAGQLLVSHLIQTTDETLALKRYIAERAEGNPFYAEEIVRMLIEEGGLAPENGRWKMTPRTNELMREVPGTLNGLILARFDRQPPELRQTLQKAAVLGSPFPFLLLRNLNGINPDVLLTQVSALEARHFLVPSPNGAEEAYAFRHALIQEVVYNTLLKRDRKQIHEQTAQVIEQSTLWTVEERNEALAHHYAEGPAPSKAIPYLIAAAEHAARNCAYETAAQHYRRASTLLQNASPGANAQRVRCQIGLGQALKFSGDYAEAFEIINSALYSLLRLGLTVDSGSLLSTLVHGLRELADIRVREGAPDEAIPHLQAGLDALGPEGDQTHGRLWRSLIDRLAWVRFRQGKLDEAFRLASWATLHLGPDDEDDPFTLASLYNTLGGVLWQQGDLSEAIAYVERSLSLHEDLGYAWGVATAYTNLGVLHHNFGNWPQAALNLQQAQELQGQIGEFLNRALTLNNLGTLRQSMGEHERARLDMETSLSICQRLGDTWGIALANTSLARLAVAQSRFHEAVTHVEVALKLSENPGGLEAEARWILALCQAENDVQQAITTAEEALQTARDAELTEAEANCCRVLGSLRARAGEYLEAELLLGESVDLCVQMNAPYNQGLALVELGRLYSHLADVDDASPAEWRGKALVAFSTAIDLFQSLGAAYDLQMAQDTLGQLQVATTREPTPTAVPAQQIGIPSTSEGAPVSPSGVLPEGEWHTAAVVWLGLSPPPDADEEEVFETLTLATPALLTIANEYDGQVIRRQDGLTLVFGAPTAYEDDAERAVQAAWQIARYLLEPTVQTQVPLTFNIAVSLGDVVAGQIGFDPHAKFVVTGEPVQLAQEIAESAPNGTVWVTEQVRAATERVFVFEPPPPAVKDRLVDRPFWALARQRERPAPARGLPGLKARFIGRETPLQIMTDLSQNLSEGIGGLVWIEGEPGIGKSRLMGEFTTSFGASGALVWVGTCTPQKSGSAFSLFSALLTQSLKVLPTDTPDQIRAKIDQALQSWPAAARMTRPYLEILLGVWPGGLDGERLAGLEPEQLRQQTFVALRRLCKSLASERPLVLVLDDLHWIDPISAELLGFLLTIVASAPILFICAQRRQGADSPNDRLVRLQGLIPTQTVSIRLERLTPDESESLLNELLSNSVLPAELCANIMRQSEGNPYFIEEYVRMLIEQGYLQQGNEGWEVNSSTILTSVPLPSSLETLLRSRVDALPQELKDLMQYAAVIGAPFEISLLATVSQEPNVEAGLRRLESRLLVQRTAKDNQWTFNHSLIESVVYGSLLKARRRMLHLHVGQALEARWTGTETDHAEQLAYHYVRADDGPKALTYLMQAGERATARYANEEAMAYFEQAAEILKTLPDGTDHIRLRLAAGLGDVYRSIGRYADSTTALESGLLLRTNNGLAHDNQPALYRRLGETAQKQGALDRAHEHFSQALALMGESTDAQAQTEVSLILTGLAWTHFFQGHFDQAQKSCESGLSYARQASALNALAGAENLLGGIYFRKSEWAPALQHTRRAMVLREQMGYTWGVAASLSNLGVLAMLAGDWNKGRSFFERSLVLQQEVGNVEGLTIVHNNLGSLGRDQGDLEKAEFHFRESLAVARRFEIGFHIANSTIGLAEILVLKGAIEAAQEAIDDCLAHAEAIGAHDMRGEVYRIQAQILLARSSWQEARASAEAAAAQAAETGNRSQESAAWRVLSEIELRQGAPLAAHEALLKAQQLATEMTDELEAGRVRAQSGRIHLSLGLYGQAEADLRAAKTIFMRLGAALDLNRVESALERPPVPQPGVSLTSAVA
jgi:predicted ATPase/class 3 adenylate cyclase